MSVGGSAVESSLSVPAPADDITSRPCGVPNRVERGVGRVVTCLVGALLTATALGAVVWPHDPNLLYRRELVVAGLLVSLTLGAGLALASEWARRRVTRGRAARIALWVTAVVISVGGAALGGWLADLVAYRYGWDAKVLTGFSEALHESGDLSPRAVDYLSRYPNNVPLLAVMNLCRAVAVDHGTDMYTVYRWFNAVCLGLSLLLVFVLVRMLRGPLAGLLAQVLTLGLVGCSPWMAVPYTDLPAIPLVLGGACLVVTGLRTQRSWVQLLALSAAGACLGSAYVIKSTPAAAAFGLCLALVVALVTVGRWRRWVTFLLATALSLGTFYGAAAATGALAFDHAGVQPQRLDSARVPPASWWAAMGLIPAQRPVGGIVYGGYNAQMVSESAFLRGTELRDWSDARLRAELGKFGGALGILEYEAHKQVFNWGDGMFYAWGEGRDVEEPLLHQTDTAKAVQSWNHGAGDHFSARASLTNGLWLALVLWAGVSLMASRYRRDLLALSLAVLGVVAFTLLFQGRSRYLFAYVPLVIALATGVDVLARGAAFCRPRNSVEGRDPSAVAMILGSPTDGDRELPRPPVVRVVTGAG